MKKISAALTFFTRLPLWKLGETPATAYSYVVVFWPLTGWITGGVMALCIWCFSFILPASISVALAIIARILLTGALHEDGLADFCDGFGGGRDKESILRIMKDSSIGAYGVIGLFCHFLLLWVLLSGLSSAVSALAIFAADPFAKCCASQLTNILAYARPEGSKNKISYSKMSKPLLYINIFSGIAPVIPLILLVPLTAVSIVLPIIGLIILSGTMRKRIGGYTGDCCGATFLICESLMLLAIVIVCNL